MKKRGNKTAINGDYFFFNTLVFLIFLFGIFFILDRAVFLTGFVVYGEKDTGNQLCNIALGKYNCLAIPNQQSVDKETIENPDLKKAYVEFPYDVRVYPSEIYAGARVTVFAYIPNKENIIAVKAMLLDENGEPAKNYIPVFLFDDGWHNDEYANDGFYAGIFNTDKAGEGKFSVKVSVFRSKKGAA